ncbi:MAG: hypothetical protein GY810_09355 [Aureispira sp.]|nr:hypothetical protein [Aureispira sp.]
MKHLITLLIITLFSNLNLQGQTTDSIPTDTIKLEKHMVYDEGDVDNYKSGLITVRRDNPRTILQIPTYMDDIIFTIKKVVDGRSTTMYSKSWAGEYKYRYVNLTKTKVGKYKMVIGSKQWSATFEVVFAK